MLRHKIAIITIIAVVGLAGCSSKTNNKGTAGDITHATVTQSIDINEITPPPRVTNTVLKDTPSAEYKDARAVVGFFESYSSITTENVKFNANGDTYVYSFDDTDVAAKTLNKMHDFIEHMKTIGFQANYKVEDADGVREGIAINDTLNHFMFAYNYQTINNTLTISVSSTQGTEATVDDTDEPIETTAP